MRGFARVGTACGISIGLFVGSLERASAQVLPDSTLGAESSELVPREEGGIQIEGGAVRGESLFHSFSEFSIEAGEAVYFANPAAIETILGRVTGDVRSDILGTLGVDGNASLYVINPNGVVFGPDAQLDIAGSLFVSTAPSLDLGGGINFSAVEPTTVPLLTISVTPGLQLEEPLGGAIVSNGATLNVGGELTLASGAIALEGGQIQAEGDLWITTDQLSLTDSGFIVSVAETEDGGDITIEVRTLSVEEGSGITAVTADTGRGGDLTINASESVTLQNNDPESSPSFISSVVFDGATGDAGDVSLQASELFLDNGAFLTNRTNSDSIGNAGDFDIDVNRLIVQNSAEISSAAFGEGAAGTLTIRASESVWVNSGFILSSAFEGTGNAGDLHLIADELSLNNGAFIASQTFLASTGDAGALRLDVRRLALENDSRISSATDGGGEGGALTIQASEAIVLNSSIIDSAAFGGAADAGDLSIVTGELSLDSGSSIVSDAFDESTGNAGDLSLDVRHLVMGGDSVISSATSGPGDGGALTIRASESVRLNASLIESSTLEGSGHAGDLNLDVRHLVMGGDSIIASATFGPGDGGALTIRASESVRLNGSRIDSSASEGVGNAGDLHITADQLALDEESEILSTTFATSAGDAGDLSIDVRYLGMGGDSVISTATAGAGKGGLLTIRASDAIALDFSNIESAAVSGTGNAGDLRIETNTLFLDNQSIIRSDTLTETSGNAGDLNIEVGRLVASDGSSISSATAGSGDGGVLAIRASDAIALDFSNIESAAVGGTGNAGDLRITTDALSLANDAVIASDTLALARGDGGNLTLDVGRLTLESSLISSATEGDGNAGDLTIRAQESVLLRGTNEEGFLNVIQTAVLPAAVGNAGNLTLTTGQLRLEDDSLLSTASLGIGQAGDLQIEATDSVIIADESALEAITTGGGPVGNLSLTTPQLIVQDSGELRVSSEGGFPAGRLTVDAEQIRLSDDASLRAETETGDDGSIRLNAEGILLQDDSSITTSATEVATGGRIDINATSFLLLLDRSRIEARATGGQGGAIDIATELFLQSEDSVIDASSALGVDGTVNFDVVETNVPAEAEVLPVTFAGVELDQRCVSNQDESGRGQFIRTGRGGLPVDADAVGSAGLWEDQRLSESGTVSVLPTDSALQEAMVEPARSPESVMEAQGWHRTETGLIVLAAEPMAVTPYSALRTVANCQAG